MENRINKFGYENTDKKIIVDLYGLEFEVSSEIENEKISEINELKKDDGKINEFIEKIIGSNAIQKINEKRKKDGYDEMTLTSKAQLIGFLMNVYAEEKLKMVGKSINDATKNMDKVSNMINTGKNKYNNYNKYRKNNYKKRY